MADIEEAEGLQGAVREWLARAARAPRDKAWVADGVISDRWAPVSPSGILDAFVWRTPDERIAALAEPAPIEAEPAAAPAAIPAPPAAPAPPPAAQSVEPPRGPPPFPAAPPPRAGIIIDPTAMAPDDPGPGEAGTERRDFRLFAGE